MQETSVYIVGGPLGSGKTTRLTNALPVLSDRHDRLSLLVNEAGTYNLDSDRLNGIGDGVNLVPYQGSCACCEGRREFTETVGHLLPGSMDGLVMETSGISNLFNLLQVYEETKGQTGFRVEDVLYLVPVAHFDVVRHSAAFASGIQVASTIGLTWADNGQTDLVEAYVRERAHPDARVIHIGTDDPVELLQGRWNYDMHIARLDGDFPSADYLKLTFPIRPEVSLSELLGVLGELEQTGVHRVKGFMPTADSEYHFDIVHGNPHVEARPVRGATLGQIFVASSVERGQLPEEIIGRICQTDNKIAFTAGTSRDEMMDEIGDAMEELRGLRLGGLDRIMAWYEPANDAFWTAWSFMQQTGEAEPFMEMQNEWTGLFTNIVTNLDGFEGQADRHILGAIHCVNLGTLLPGYEDEPYADYSEDFQPEIRHVLQQRFLRILGNLGDADYATLMQLNDPGNTKRNIRGLVSLLLGDGTLDTEDVSRTAGHMVKFYADRDKDEAAAWRKFSYV